jgi:uncharacterized membrane protein
LISGIAQAEEAASAPPAQPAPVVVQVPAPPQPLTGLWLTTPFPGVTVRVGDAIKFDLTVENKNRPPARIDLSVSGLPEGWTSEIEGSGKPVSAVLIGADQSQSLVLQVTPPPGAKIGAYPFTLTGKTDGQTLSLPINLVLAEPKEAKATLEPKLPALRGSVRSSFDFQVTLKNDSAEDQVYNLLAAAPEGFEAVFSESYGSQELTSIPVKAGETKDLKVAVKLPQNAAAGQYQVVARAQSPKAAAETPLFLDVTGQPTLALAGPEGRLSGDATAGKEREFAFTLRNTGSAPARDVKLDATAPDGWKVVFEPKEIPAVEAGQEITVNTKMTPSEKAIAGDYVVSIRANGGGASANAEFRVTVLTSTLWGIAGLGVIGAAVIVLAVAVTRYGRR